MAGTAWLRRRGWGLVTGAVVTGVAALAVVLGWSGQLERWWLDYLFRHVNRVAADPRIVMVDINDAALDRIHRWPWPRRLQADLVDVLSECGAAAIVLDLVYTEPSPGRIEDPRLDPDHELDPAAEILGDPGCLPFDEAVFDDRELAAALARCGHGYVAMYFRPTPDGAHAEWTRRRSRELIYANPELSLAEYAAGLGRRPDEQVTALYTQTRLDHLLRKQFDLDFRTLAELLDVTPDTVELFINAAKDLAARYLVAEHLSRDAQASFADVFASILPGQRADADSPDRRDLLRAYRHELAARHVYAQARPFDPSRDAGLPWGREETLPIAPIAQAARRVGFVTFEKDSDGVVRHVPLLAVVADRVVLQLGFALACDTLEVNPDALRVDARGTLLLTDRRGVQRGRVPLDPRGEALLNWHVDPQSSVWERSFVHIPAARVMEVALNRRVVRQNEARRRFLLTECVELMHAGTRPAYLDYLAKVDRLNGLRQQLQDGAEPAYSDSEDPRDAETDEPDLRAQIAALESELAAVERSARGHLQRLEEEIQDLTPVDAEEEAHFARVRSLARKVAEQERGHALNNATLEQQNARILSELRGQLAGKFCFVGHTAAAQADLVNTPVYENMPGVMAHANLVNMLLQNRVPEMVARPAVLATIIFAGLLMTMLANWRDPWTALASMLLLVAASLGLSAWLMWSRAWYLSTLPAAGAVSVVWALVTLFRQLTEERQRRRFARELARNTSPAIAARIADQLDDLDLTPRPADVTCYFSDLQGFTTISERLGSEGTKTLLNAYLGTMGEVLMAHHAFNKFMGDGIFAFFNAPIWPRADHAATGCAAALETVAQLARLQEAGGPFAGELRRLRMRVGLHTGPAFVGYFGSENQTDYTCIGDTVNLAARLEAANKVLGTQILVSDVCRRSAGEGFAYRYLGALQVRGKTAAVEVHELLGRLGNIGEADLDYAATFAEALACFQDRDWPAAERLLRQLVRRRPEDLAAQVYLAETVRLAACPPGPDWNRALELTTK